MLNLKDKSRKNNYEEDKRHAGRRNNDVGI